MWSEVRTEPEAQECIDIMKLMDRNYQAVDLDKVKQCAQDSGLFGYIYKDGDKRIVLAMQPGLVAGLLRVYTAGFTGSLTAQQAAELTIDKLLAIMAERRIGSICAVIRDVDNELLNQAISIATQSTKVRVRVRGNNEKFTFLQVSAVDCSDKSCSFTWTGIEWVKVVDDCKDGCSCTAPGTSGTFIGQVAIVNCT